jgi:hypothetical protein
MISLSANTQKLSQEISQIQKRIRDSQLQHDSQLDELKNMMEVFGDDVNTMMAEAEPVFLLVDRIEKMHQSILAAYDAVSRSSDTMKGPVLDSDMFSCVSGNDNQILVTIYVFIITITGYFYHWIVAFALKILLAPTTEFRRGVASKLLSDGTQ